MCECGKKIYVAYDEQPSHIQKMKEARDIGKTIEYLKRDGVWATYHGSMWLACNTFRIKPEEAASPHKHAALIKAWADGAEIEYFGPTSQKWIALTHPSWRDCDEYRIKPVPKPDRTFYGVVKEYPNKNPYGGNVGPFDTNPENNIKLVFDGETGKLKSVSLL